MSKRKPRIRLLARSVAVILLAALTWECHNDLVVIAPYQDVPVVYCILNPNDSTHYVRVEKSFLGEASALDMARETDSIYYPDGEVFIERWLNGNRMESYQLERRVASARDSGIFTHDPNILYVFNAPLQTNSEYRIQVSIPSTGASVSGSTQVVSQFRVTKPESYKQTFAFSSYENYQTVEWITAPYTRIYQLQIRFHYLEVMNRDTIEKSQLWNIGHFTTVDGSGGERIATNILHRRFYQWLGNKLSPATEGMVRLATRKALDFVFTVGGEELFMFMEVNKPESGPPREKPAYTNLVGGLGLFSSRFKLEIKGKGLTYHSIDSLASGMYTNTLGFANSRDDYYIRGF
ncbi:MAG: DUF4249 family protein [Bacteroidales bacterium]|nr:DUF4249 family protein [Bacteroidales bacterium]